MGTTKPNQVGEGSGGRVIKKRPLNYYYNWIARDNQGEWNQK